MNVPMWGTASLNRFSFDIPFCVSPEWSRLSLQVTTISVVASHVKKKKNHRAGLSLLKINMVMGCTVLRSSRPHLKIYKIG